MPPPRILVVDDEESQLLLLERILAGAGFRVHSAATSREALRLAASQEFDLALLDVVIDELDGYALCRRFKEDPRTANLPVIFVTGERGSTQMKVRGFAAGAVDYLLKPVDAEELVARVRVMLELERARAELRTLADSLAEQVERRTRQLREALEALEQQKALSEEIVGSVPMALLVLDGRGRAMTWNRAFEAAFGAPDRSTPLESQPALEPLARALRELDAAGEGGATLRTARGEARRFRLESSALGAQAEGGEGARVVTLSDITARELADGVLRGREPAQILAEMEDLRRELSGRYTMADVVAFAPGMLEVTRMVDTLRHGRCPVLIQGESGTGKELVARALHYDGPHSNAPFVPIHCGAISRDLIESELFGHEKGAFTGAFLRKQGLFKAADGGTIFLDEVGEVSPASQVKLLRVLQEGSFMPVGSSELVRVDVRVVAATNKVLADEVAKGAFREDLFYRLNVVCIEVPPLRERSGDIPCLVAHFIQKYNLIYARKENPVRDVSKAVLELFEGHRWPGNVRELENTVVRAFELHCGEVLQVKDLPPYLQGRPGPAAPARTDRDRAGGRPAPIEIPRPGKSLLDYERLALIDALERAGGDKLEAARNLGIGKSTLYRKLKRLGIR